MELIADERISYGFRDAGAVVGLSEDTIRRLVDSGDLPHVRVKDRRLVLREDLLAYLRSRSPDGCAVTRRRGAGNERRGIAGRVVTARSIERPVYDAEEAAEMVGMSPKCIRNLVDAGEIPEEITRESLVEFMRRCVEREAAGNPFRMPRPAPRWFTEAADPVVYYVTADIGFAVVKIGKTGNLARRLAALLASSPVSVKLAAWEPMEDHQLESRRHQEFSGFRHNGEWFRMEGALADHVRALANLRNAEAEND